VSSFTSSEQEKEKFKRAELWRMKRERAPRAFSTYFHLRRRKRKGGI